MLTPDQRRMRRNLLKTRAADAAHDAKMRDLLEGSGVTLEDCRAAGIRSREKDAFMLRAFREAARVKQETGL